MHNHFIFNQNQFIMKKLLLLSALVMSIFLTAQAGYVIRGIQTYVSSDDLKNYTLTFYKDDGPICAASMYTTSAPGVGKNTIAIIRANTSAAHLFPLVLPNDIPAINNVEVRDFHYDASSDSYVLCGSRQLGNTTNAFVAIINHDFTQMRFFEYQSADMFYSLCFAYQTSPTPVLSDYYVCGTRGSHGVIASIDRVSFQVINFSVTATEWEYHKIIAKYSQQQIVPHFVASGKNPGCTRIGFTTVDSQFNVINNYAWVQQTEPRSHCVVAENVLTENAVILASSYQNIVTLNPVNYPIMTATIRAYRFQFPSGSRYSVQDIATLQLTDATFRISVAGFAINLFSAPLQTRAWHGYMIGLSPTSIMQNNYYYNTSEQYEHYKIRYQKDPNSPIYKEYTGGYFQSAFENCALFGTPLTLFDECDHLYQSSLELESISWGTFSSIQVNVPNTPQSLYSSTLLELLADDYCGTFKGEALTPELVSPAEQEGEIITYYDHITIKDVPQNTNYQIYTITGQLIQTGFATPDISTAQLSKGIYILRLENGKAFKFVK